MSTITGSAVALVAKYLNGKNAIINVKFRTRIKLKKCLGDKQPFIAKDERYFNDSSAVVRKPSLTDSSL
ncbi:MAG: hypothetical protein M3264_14130 [Thermoproteota archaeon]|nr:hypothetical protein [Thermoproteota archaeon]